MIERLTKTFSGSDWLEEIGVYSATLIIEFSADDEAVIDLRTIEVVTVDELEASDELNNEVLHAVVDYAHSDEWENEVSQACRHESMQCETNTLGQWAA